MEILKDICYNAVETFGYPAEYYEKRDKLSELHLACEDAFLKSLSEEQKKLFEEYEKCVIERHQLDELYEITTIFRYAVRMAVEIFGTSLA